MSLTCFWRDVRLAISAEEPAGRLQRPRARSANSRLKLSDRAPVGYGSALHLVLKPPEYIHQLMHQKSIAINRLVNVFDIHWM